MWRGRGERALPLPKQSRVAILAPAASDRDLKGVYIVKKILLSVSIAIMALGLIAGFSSPAEAKVTGPCVNCHTMHNSQDGTSVSTDGPYETLLTDDCVGCHSSTSSSTTYPLGNSTVPVVNYTGGEPVDYLAGGNFWWVADSGGNDDTKGHNVLGIASQDLNITADEGAPGNAFDCTNSCHKTLAVAQTAVADLGRGCQGCHLNVMHHADDSATVVDSTGGWYRFLSGHMSGDGHGVQGIEDDDWQATKGSGDHNEYLGFVGVDKTNSAAFYNLGNTMTAYCSGCHGNFHVQQDSGRWVRHPSDAVIPQSGEYAEYTTYDPIVPVARPDLSGYAGSSETVTPGIDLVMCLSCHRPHGSPYNDILRWDYAGMIAGGGGSGGCFTCHTQKN